ncbi:MAG TPA: hypothetical protein DCO79_11905 [Spirochaeta sp.]|nr:hypothetical protein [Spirochaeta sp.]
MYEIYEKHAVNYDELVTAEDYQDNLGKYLREKIEWRDKTVYEAGIGTGRITNYYISEVSHCFGFDREEHMMQKCLKNHVKNTDKLTLNIAENLGLPKLDRNIDVFIEGWSFGHTLYQNTDDLSSVISKLVDSVIELVSSDGDIFIIESLGTNVEKPIYYSDEAESLYDKLENKYKFERTTLETDYRYDNPKEASRIMGFFFGEEMKLDIFKKNKSIVKEFTGAWYLKKK